MKRKRLFTISSVMLFSFFICFMACKKYPNGGRVNKSHKSLRLSWNDNYEKQWKVKLFEVNEVDSTSYFNKVSHSIGSSGDFNGFDLRINGFFIEKHNFTVQTAIFNYSLYLNAKKDSLFFSKKLTGSPRDSDTIYHGFDCENFNKDCQRNIFMPERPSNKAFGWKILRLNKKEMIIFAEQKNRYRIILEYIEVSV